MFVRTGNCNDKVCKFKHSIEAHMDFTGKVRRDKFKTSNCRLFYKEKYCPHGFKCHFRHDFKSFDKIHRVFYSAHAEALRFTHEEILQESES